MAAMNEPVVRPRRALYISAVLGGGTTMQDVEAQIRRLAGIVRQLDESLPAQDPVHEAAVDATFHVPGDILRPEYEGLRTGRWVKAKQLLVVQIAVPADLSGSPAIEKFLAESLGQAVTLASEYLARRRLGLSVDRAARIASDASRLVSLQG